MPSAFRTAVPDDAPALVDLVNEAFEVESYIRTGQRLDLAEIRARLARGSFLVRDGESGSLAACVYVEVRGRTGHLGLVSVAESAQGAGLGRSLVSAAESWLREAGCDVSELWVFSVRSKLKAWYRRLGYRVVRSEPFAAVSPPPGQTLLIRAHFDVMEREL